VPSGFTYLGQFLDHTLRWTERRSPTQITWSFSSIREVRSSTRFHVRDGPDGNPELYDSLGRFLFSTPNGFEDLQRDTAGKAILVESRNDENLVIAQFHIAFQKFHNSFIGQGQTFQAAQKLVRCMAWIVVHQFLPEIVGQDTVDRFLTYNGRAAEVPGRLFQTKQNSR